MAAQPISLLLVEDDELDTEALQRALRKRQFGCPLMAARDGSEALELLHEGQQSSPRPRPLVLLDLNMPGMNGHEFLNELRRDPDIGNTIVFVFTSSSHERDIKMAYDRHVAGYFLKSELDALVGVLENYAEGVQLPPVTV